MRKLHLVGVTSDLEGLLFTARRGSKTGGYVVALDESLLDAIAEARQRRDGDPMPAEARPPLAPAAPASPANRSRSNLTPREMQARLRAGRSIDEVAAEAGVDTDWVQRFAVPIMAEQAQVVELARGLSYSKPRLGESSLPLAESVVWNLSDRGVWLSEDILERCWSAYQLHDSVWMVRFRYRARGRDQEALWELEVPEARLVSRNRLAAELGYVEKGRRRGEGRVWELEETVEETDPATKRPASKPIRAAVPTGRKAVAKRAAKAAGKVGPAKAAGKTAASKTGPSKTVPGKTVPSRTGPSRTGLSKTVPGKTVPSKTVPSKTVPSKTVPSKTVPGKGATSTGRRKAPAKVPSAPPVPERPRGRGGRTPAAPKARSATSDTKGAPAEPPRRIGTTFVPPGGSASARGHASAFSGDEAAPRPAVVGVRAVTTQLTTARVAASRTSSGRMGTPAAPGAAQKSSRSTGLRSVLDRDLTASLQEAPFNASRESAIALPPASPPPSAPSPASRAPAASPASATSPASARAASPAQSSRSASGRAQASTAEPLEWDLEMDLLADTDAGEEVKAAASPSFSPRPLPASGGSERHTDSPRVSALRARSNRSISQDLAGDEPLVRVDSSIPAPAAPAEEASGRRRRGRRWP